jgi:L-ascorbate metabolism protein UlaG (beta-lactamase superfamily)
MRIAFTFRIALLVTCSSGSAQTQSTLEARFIGNMAYAISDGTVTLFTDFPYESGYSRYMTYEGREIRSRTPRSLALITHGHRDHWEAALFSATDWSVIGPADAVRGAAASRVVRSLPVAPERQGVTFEGLSIDAVPTPHAGIGHYSYLVTWHGLRLYFTGDTDDAEALLNAKNLDVAFVSPWLFERARKNGRPIDARRIVIYHQELDQTAVPGCSGTCSVPKQGDVLRLSR